MRQVFRLHTSICPVMLNKNKFCNPEARECGTVHLRISSMISCLYLKHLKLYSMNPLWPKFSSLSMQTRARTLLTFKGTRKYKNLFRGTRKYKNVFTGTRRYKNLFTGTRRYKNLFAGTRKYKNLFTLQDKQEQ